MWLCACFSVVAHLFLPVPVLCSLYRQTTRAVVSTCPQSINKTTCKTWALVCLCASPLFPLKCQRVCWPLEGRRPLSESLLDLWTLPRLLYVPAETLSGHCCCVSSHSLVSVKQILKCPVCVVNNCLHYVYHVSKVRIKDKACWNGIKSKRRRKNWTVFNADVI